MTQKFHLWVHSPKNRNQGLEEERYLGARVHKTLFTRAPQGSQWINGEQDAVQTQNRKLYSLEEGRKF